MAAVQCAVLLGCALLPFGLPSSDSSGFVVGNTQKLNSTPEIDYVGRKYAIKFFIDELRFENSLIRKYLHWLYLSYILYVGWLHLVRCLVPVMASQVHYRWCCVWPASAHLRLAGPLVLCLVRQCPVKALRTVGAVSGPPVSSEGLYCSTVGAVSDPPVPLKALRTVPIEGSQERWCCFWSASAHWRLSGPLVLCLVCQCRVKARRTVGDMSGPPVSSEGSQDRWCCIWSASVQWRPLRTVGAVSVPPVPIQGSQDRWCCVTWSASAQRSPLRPSRLLINSLHPRFMPTEEIINPL